MSGKIQRAHRATSAAVLVGGKQIRLTRRPPALEDSALALRRNLLRKIYARLNPTVAGRPVDDSPHRL